MVKVVQRSWLGGQLDIEMLGRQDVAKYRKGATLLKNFLPVRRGSLRKRPGTDFVADVTSYVNTGKFRLVPFAYRQDEGYAILFKANGAYAVCDAGGSGAVVTVTGSVPYGEDELNDIVTCQCGDILYIAHRNHPPAEIRHTLSGSAHVFTYAPCDIGAANVPTPEITNAQVSRNHLGYDYRGGENTDRYAVSVVYEREDGTTIESKPYYMRDDWTTGASSGNDKKFGVATGESVRVSCYKPTVVKDDSVETHDHRSEWYGTTYFLPFTESQRIELTIALPDTSMKVRQIRVYKDHGGVYGLIGVEGSDKFGNWNLGTHSANVKKLYSQPTFSGGTWTAKATVYKTGSTATVTRTLTASGSATDTTLSFSGAADSTVSAHSFTLTRTKTFAFVDSGQTPDTSVTPLDDTPVFEPVSDGEPKNYPGCVSLYQQRLVWASSERDPARIWMSMTGDFYENRPHVIQQSDDPVDFILPITQFAEINHITELGRLFAFTASSELLVGSNSDVSGLTYETIQATTQSHVGSRKRLPPIVANNSILFCERTGQAVRDFSFDIGRNLYGGTDVSIFANSIFNEKAVVDWTWQQQPNSTAWMVLSDGTLATLCYMTDQEIVAWATHVLGGGGAAKAVCKTCSLYGTDSANPTTSTILLAVERGTGANRKVTIERMNPWPHQEADSVAALITMDCCRRTVLAASAAVPAGMAYVNISTGMVYHAGQTAPAGTYQGGYPFEARLDTVHPSVSDQDIGAGQFDLKNVQNASLRLVNSIGGKVRPYGLDASLATALETFAPALRPTMSGTVQTPLTDVRCILTGSNSRDGRITVTQDEPWPFEIVSLECEIAVEPDQGLSK